MARLKINDERKKRDVEKICAESDDENMSKRKSVDKYDGKENPNKFSKTSEENVEACFVEIEILKDDRGEFICEASLLTKDFKSMISGIVLDSNAVCAISKIGNDC